jgi:uncharacterized protein YkwD
LPTPATQPCPSSPTGLAIHPAAARPARRALRVSLATYALALLFALALLSPAVSPARRAAAAPVDSGAAGATAALTFAATGHSVKSAAFINYFQSYGGVQTFGYPISEETWENGRLVQYFERQRFEYHAENAGTSYEVLLGRLGDEYSRPRQPFAGVAAFADTATRIYVPQTGHALAEPFLSYWRTHGGVRILGYPISEVVSENGLQVQYFERARFERHPENAGSAYEVLLSLLGKVSFEQHGSPAAQAPAAPAPAPAASPVNAMESRLLEQINGARAAAGLGAVTLDPQLIALARDRSADMANRHYFAHKTPDGKDFLGMLRERAIPYYMAGEIIAENNYPVAQTVDQAFAGYMHSPEHHDIIMMGNWRVAGVGEAVDGAGMYYYTVLFSQPSK